MRKNTNGRTGSVRNVSREAITGRHLVSKPGAALKVERIEVSESVRKGLTTSAKSIDSQTDRKHH